MPVKRVCLDCPALITTGPRCPTCTRRRDKARGTRQTRGYDANHDAARTAWAPRVAAGQVQCRRAPYGRCLEPSPLIAPDEPWQLGHPDHDCPAPRAPEHRRCNLTTAPRRGGGDP